VDWNQKKFLAAIGAIFFLIACSGQENLDTKAYLEANRPAWVPETSALTFGVDGSLWADCNWQDDQHVCRFYDLDREAWVQQSYQLCSVKETDLTFDGFAQSWKNKYESKGLYFLPVTPPAYYEQGRLKPSPKSDEEFRSLDKHQCVQAFSPLP